MKSFLNEIPKTSRDKTTENTDSQVENIIKFWQRHKKNDSLGRARTNIKKLLKDYDISVLHRCAILYLVSKRIEVYENNLKRFGNDVFADHDYLWEKDFNPMYVRSLANFFGRDKDFLYFLDEEVEADLVARYPDCNGSIELRKEFDHWRKLYGKE